MSNAPVADPNVRPPFWKHRYYYLALKIIVLAVGILVARCGCCPGSRRHEQGAALSVRYDAARPFVRRRREAGNCSRLGAPSTNKARMPSRAV